MGCGEAEGEDEKMGFLVDNLWKVIGLKKNSLEGWCEENDEGFKDFRNGVVMW